MNWARKPTIAHGATRMLRLACLVVMALCSCTVSRGQSPTGTKPGAESLLRITEEAHGLANERGRPQVRVIVEIRGDTPEKERFTEDLWKRYHEAFPPDQRINYGPDSGFTQIDLRSKAGKLVIGSWHTVEVVNPKIAATAHGLTALEGRKRANVLAEQPAKYRRFREAFDAILAAANRFERR